jgi:uncharacterized RDD family membrane protein YckC
MECPNCKLLNPAGAMRCDCGFSFVDGSLRLATDAAGVPLNLASLQDRVLAQILDTLLTFAPFIPSMIIARVWETGATISSVAAIPIGLFYWLFADGLPGGQSFGKKLLGISVIDANTGRACDLGASCIRNVLLVLFGWLDVAFMLGGTRRQRLGDKVAQTFVVKGKALPR